MLKAAFNDTIVKRLVKIATVGGVITLGTGLYFQSKIRRDIRNTPYYKESFKILNQCQDVPQFMGPPITVGNIDLGCKDNYHTEKEAYMQVPLEGKLHKGILHLWASRNDRDSNWNVDRLELAVKDIPGKRILVHHTDKLQEN